MNNVLKVGIPSQKRPLTLLQNHKNAPVAINLVMKCCGFPLDHHMLKKAAKSQKRQIALQSLQRYLYEVTS